jgi:hypothetical protein
MPFDTQLFLGVSTGPARGMVAELWRQGRFRRVLLPCVGRFAVAIALADAGCVPGSMECSDLALFSSIIGYLADPRHDLSELGIAVPEEAQPFLADTEPYSPAWAAGLLVAVKWLTMPKGNLYYAAMRTEVKESRFDIRAHIEADLSETLRRLGPVRYDVADVRDVIEELVSAGDDTLAHCSLPVYRGGYTKQYGEAEDVLRWDGLVGKEFDPAEFVSVLERLADAKPLVLVETFGDQPHAEAIGAGWVPVLAIANKDRTDHLFANRDPNQRAVVTQRMVGKPRHYPIWAEGEIRADSSVSLEPVDADTGLHYRDLFIHNLGATRAEMHFLLMIDGRVSGAIGMMVRDVQMGRSSWVGIPYAIATTSRRYPRIGKLLMLMAIAGDTKELLLRLQPPLALQRLDGIQTTTIGPYAEHKLDRGVLTLHRREQPAPGTYRLIYRGSFGEGHWADALTTWRTKWASD